MKCPVEILDEDLDQLSLNQRNLEQRVETDFSEYAWMADELEEFDRKVEEELWEEFFIEACFEEMYEDEEDDCMMQSDGKTIGMEKLECLQAIQALQALQAQNHALNPNAPEFIPRSSLSCEQFENDDYAQR